MLLHSTAHIERIHREAMKALSERRFDAALGGFRQVLKVIPDHVDALYQVGRILIAGDRAPKAIGFLSRAAGTKPQNAAYWQVWAEAVALGGTQENEADFLAALKKAPIPLAERLSLQDRFGALRAASRPATGGLRPKDVQRLTALIAGGDFAQAERQSLLALKSHPKSAIAANIAAVAQAAQRKYQTARANFHLAIRLDGRYAEAYENFGRMLREIGQPVDAAEVARKAVILAPGRIQALVLLGELLTAVNEARAALPVLLRATGQEPDSVPALVALANAHARMNSNDEAEAIFARVVELLPEEGQSDIRAALGIAQSRIGKDQQALDNLDKALSAKPDHPLALGGKAGVLQTLGKFEEAREYFLRATQVDPLNGENYRQLIATHNTVPGDKILADMLEIYSGSALTENARMNMAFAISKALEDVKEFGSIFKYLDQANALMRKSHPYFIDKRFREVESLKSLMGGIDFHNMKVDGTSDFAPIFVTGMPRSGTTLVEQIISSHSTITGAGELSRATVVCNQLLYPGGKPRLLAAAPDTEIAALGSDYQSYVNARIPDAARITDKAISTFNYIGLLKLALPNARFVVVRRDPRDNLLSIYKNKFPDGTHGYAYDQVDLAKYYGTFVEMIDFWRERVPDWFYEVQYEDLVANPEPETRKLIAACGLGWEDACLNFHENKRKVQTLSVYQVRQPISQASVKGWKRYEQELKPMLDALREAGHVTD